MHALNIGPDYDWEDEARDKWDDACKRQGLPKGTREIGCPLCGGTTRLVWYAYSFDHAFGIYKHPGGFLVTSCGCEWVPGDTDL